MAHLQKSTVAFLKSANQLDHFIYTSIGNEGAPMRPYYNDMISGMRANQPAGKMGERSLRGGYTIWSQLRQLSALTIICSYQLI